MSAILALTRADLRTIGRDSMLNFLLLYPWLLGLLMRWLIGQHLDQRTLNTRQLLIELQQL